MYKEMRGAKEINISHNLSDRNNMKKEKLRIMDADLYLKSLPGLRAEKS